MCLSDEIAKTHFIRQSNFDPPCFNDLNVTGAMPTISGTKKKRETAYGGTNIHCKQLKHTWGDNAEKLKVKLCSKPTFSNKHTDTGLP
jgi:hypothetical protein